ncbi:Uncharacterised protein [Clostridium disporicum]|uniref:Uncharacterized protein n=1 Tax=Clostridium disporicum TaxID=84024 RepID=A0A173XAW0_9CLOT|nr:Uncharacterised protein [Clostridium disporicum]CUO06353.1 Uncharacterised protein [Clostridium disporicum]SCJ51601.1 Uncharacterised protein [uncultured Clostridium sp.]
MCNKHLPVFYIYSIGQILLLIGGIKYGYELYTNSL